MAIKDKSDVSSYDKVTMIVAVIALLLSVVTSYFQHFHQKTELSFGSFDVSPVISTNKDTLSFPLDVLLLNTGKNPIALTDWSTFLTTNNTIPDACYGRKNWGSISRNDTKWYTYGCGNNSQEIIEPSTIKYVSANLKIDNNTALAFFKMNMKQIDGSKADLNLGIKMNFVDAKGKEKTHSQILCNVGIDFDQNNMDAIHFSGYTMYTKKIEQSQKFIY